MSETEHEIEESSENKFIISRIAKEPSRLGISYDSDKDEITIHSVSTLVYILYFVCMILLISAGFKVFYSNVLSNYY